MRDTAELVGWSNYGQTFGIISGFFAALAFLSVLYTIHLQQAQSADSAAHNERMLALQTKQLADSNAHNQQMVMLQNKQLADSNAHNEKTIGKLQDQIVSMNRAAEIQALSAVLSTLTTMRATQILGPQVKTDMRIQEAMERLAKILDLKV